MPVESSAPPSTDFGRPGRLRLVTRHRRSKPLQDSPARGECPSESSTGAGIAAVRWLYRRGASGYDALSRRRPGPIRSERLRSRNAPRLLLRTISP
jgi:hypothetical protein